MVARTGKWLWIVVMIVLFAAIFHHVRSWLVTSLTSSVNTHKATPTPTPTRIVPPSVPVETDRYIHVQLTTATTTANPFLFYADETAIIVHPGERKTIYFHVKNLSEQPAAFQTVLHISPENFSHYLKQVKKKNKKHEVLKPKQEITLPVTFFIDPHLPRSLSHLTLNDTLFLIQPASHEKMK